MTTFHHNAKPHNDVHYNSYRGKPKTVLGRLNVGALSQKIELVFNPSGDIIDVNLYTDDLTYYGQPVVMIHVSTPSSFQGGKLDATEVTLEIQLAHWVPVKAGTPIWIDGIERELSKWSLGMYRPLYCKRQNNTTDD